MYRQGDLIKIDFDVQVAQSERAWAERWLACPYVTVFENQSWSDIVRVLGIVHEERGTVGNSPTPLYIYSENSKLIERQDDE